MLIFLWALSRHKIIKQCDFITEQSGAKWYNLNYEAGQKRLLRFQLGAGGANTPCGFKERLLGLK